MKTILKVTGWITLSVFLLLLLIHLVFRIPAVQKKAVDYLTQTLTEQSGFPIHIQSFHISFPKKMEIGGLSIVNPNQDTLVGLDHLEASISIGKLFLRKIKLKQLTIEGLKSNIYRAAGDSVFNIQPLFDGGSAQNKTNKKSSKKWEIQLQEIQLINHDLLFADSLMGQMHQAKIGKLALHMNGGDPFELLLIGKSVDLSDIDYSLSIWETGFEKKDQPMDTIKKPKILFKPIEMKEVNLDNVTFHLNLPSKGLFLKAKVKQGQILPERIDIAKQSIFAHRLHLDKSGASLQFAGDTLSPKLETATANLSKPGYDSLIESTKTLFGEIGWHFKVQDLKLENSFYTMDFLDEPSYPEKFDYSHMSFDEVNFRAQHVVFHDSLIEANIEHATATDRCGIELTNMRCEYQFKPLYMEANNLEVATQNSSLSGRVIFGYPSIRGIVHYVNKMYFDADVTVPTIDFNEAMLFIPETDSFDIPEVPDIRPSAVIDAKGYLDNLDIARFEMQTRDSSNMLLTGSIKGLPKLSALQYDLTLDTLYLTDPFFRKVIQDSVIDFTIPEYLVAEMEVNGNAQRVEHRLSVRSDLGELTSSGSIILNDIFEPDSIDLTLAFNDLSLGNFAEELETVELDGKLDFRSIDILKSKRKVEMAMILDGLTYESYLFDHLNGNLDWRNQQGNILVETSSGPATISLEADVSELNKGLHGTLLAEIEDLDLQKLGLSKEQERVTAQLRITGKVADQLADLELEFPELKLYKDEKDVDLSNIKADALLSDQQLQFNLTSNQLDANLKSNASFDEFMQIVKLQLNRFVPGSERKIYADKNFEYEVEFKDTDFLKYFIDIDLNIDIKELSGNYRGKSNQLKLNVGIDELTYQSAFIRDFEFSTTSDFSRLDALLTIGSLGYDSLVAQTLNVGVSISDSTFESSYSMLNEDSSYMYNLPLNIIKHDSSTIIELPKNGFVVKNNEWTRSENGTIIIGDRRPQRIQFQFENQVLGLNYEESGLSLFFQNYDLNNFTSRFVEHDSLSVFEGHLNGNVAYNFDDALFSLNLNSKDVIYKELELASINVGLNHQKGAGKANIAMKKQQDFILAEADWNSNNDQIQVHSVFDWKQFEFFNLLLSDITITDSHLMGNVDMELYSGDIQMNGNVDIQKMLLTYLPWGKGYSFNDNTISIRHNTIYMHNQVIKDSNEKPLKLDGEVSLSNLANPSFDLKINADNFQLINSTLKDNEVLHGQLFIESDLAISGSLLDTEIRGDLAINEQTQLTYILPSNDLEVITDAGLVVWDEQEVVQAEELVLNTDTITNLLKDFILDANFSIKKGANFTVYTNPVAGDVAEVKVQGTINLKQEEQIPASINGLLQFDEGYYQLSFYGLVKKRFDIVPNSKVVFAGNIRDATLDISANYDVKTNSIGLMASESGVGESSNYNQRLPYSVVLDVSGLLNNPNIQFLLDLPQNYRYNYMIISNKLDQLNSPNYEDERNKQVFALLVTGNFMVDNPNATTQSNSANFATSAAKNSVNGILTNQLNNLSDKYITFVDFNLGVSSYDYYTSGRTEARTDLDLQVSKRLFNDRVTVELDSRIPLETGNSNVNTSNFLEYGVFYEITPDGTYRLKAFRENAYDLFDGEIQNSGFALIFIKDFDKAEKRKKKKEREESKVETTVLQDDEM